MTKQEYEEALRALLQTSDMKKWTWKTGPIRFSHEGQIHPCGLCGVRCKVVASYETGNTMEQHHAPCGALCGNGLYHGGTPHLATSCPSCNPQG